MRFVLPVVLLVSAGCATAPAKPNYLEVLEGHTRVDCRGAGLEGAFGSRLARGAMFESIGGERGAWAEVEAIALENGDGERTCQNVSRLWVREAGASRVVFTQRPGWEGRNGNALELIDWSPDGSRLLLELLTWTYPTDPVDPLVLIWDARTRQTNQLDLTTALRAQFGSGCAVRARGQGFDSEGRTVIRVEPVEETANPSCLDEAESWILSEDPARAPERSVEQVPTWSRRVSPPPRAGASHAR